MMIVSDQDASAGPVSEQRRNLWLFSALLACFCGWVLSLPVFPSQDGPAHKFYAGVLAHKLHGDPYNDAYLVRMPPPSYASQDYLLAAASNLVDIDLAEKLFVCLVLILTAFGVRWCCQHIGAGGASASLFAMPLLLHWPLMMGFMNYAFGLGLLLVAFSLWLRMERDGVSRWWWSAFAALVVLMMFTHPVTLLMLLLLCGYDLLTQIVWVKPRERHAPGISAQRSLAILVLCGALAYPLLNVNTTRSTHDVARTAFKFHSYVNEAMLVGLSPFYRHSALVSVNVYRVSLYALLAAALLLGGRQIAQHYRARRLTRGDFMLGGAVLLLLIIPIMPDSVNGALDFFIRMLVMVWILALFGASQYSLSARGRTVAQVAAVVLAGIALLPAERCARPASRQTASLRQLQLPADEHGLILALTGPNLVEQSRQFGLAADPDLWASMVPMLRAHDVVINSPWIDATYMALRPGSDPKLLYNILPTEKEREDIDQRDGDISHDNAGEEARTFRAADFLFVLMSDGQPVTLEKKYPGFVRAFSCDLRGWYMLCLRREQHVAAD